MLLLPPPTNSAAELKVKLQTLVASKLKTHFDSIGIIVIIGEGKRSYAKRRKDIRRPALQPEAGRG